MLSEFVSAKTAEAQILHYTQASTAWDTCAAAAACEQKKITVTRQHDTIKK